MDNIMVETRRYKNIKITEEFVKDILLSSDANLTLLDMSGADLSGDEVYYVCDTILGYRLFAYQSVNISYTNIAVGFDTVINTIVECKGLHTLCATNNELSHENGVSIARLLSTTGSLKKLDLSANKLSDKGIAAIFGTYSKDFTTDVALSINLSLFSLTELNLRNNDIHDMGVLALCKGLRQFIRHNKTIDRMVALKKIYLNGNHIGDKGAFSLAQLLKLQSPDECGRVFRLEELGLNDNDIGPAGLNELLNECMIDTTINVVDKKKCKCTLQKLYIGNNRPDLSVLETLSGLVMSLSSQLIAPSYYAQALEFIDLQFTEAGCKALLQEASSYLYSEKRVIAEKGGILTSIFKQLSLVLPEITAPLIVDVGLLPKVLTLQCLICYDNDDFKQFYDISGALCALGDPVVAEYLVIDTEIYDWINGSLRTMNTNQINDTSILPLIQELDDSKMDLIPTQAVVDNSLVTDGYNSVSERRSPKEVTSITTSASSLIAFPDGDAYVNVESEASKRKYIEPKSDLKRSQNEFTRLRSEHQQAFNVLASEIKKLLLAENTLSVAPTNEFNINEIIQTIIKVPGQHTPDSKLMHISVDENTNESPFSISEMMSSPPIVTTTPAINNDRIITDCHEGKHVEGTPIMYGSSPATTRAIVDAYNSSESKKLLQNLVKDAVLSALQSSKLIEADNNNSTATVPESSTHESSTHVNHPVKLEEQFNQMIVRMDLMQERVASLEAELITKNVQTKNDHETILLLATKMQQSEKSNSDQVTRLQERISELENAITEEHESSLLLLSKLVVMQ